MSHSEHIPTTPESLSQEHDIRVAKVHALKEKGIEAWPEFKKVEHTAVFVLEAGKKRAGNEESSEKYTLAGRVMARREHGKTMFLVIQDRTATIQLYVKKDIVGEEQFHHIQHFIDIGDHVWATGPEFTTKTGEVTIKVEQLVLESKSLHPLADKFHGLTDVEQRYRHRYLDLMCNHETREKFIKRSRIISDIRGFLNKKEFIEVETPMLHPIPGGAAARPFTTHHNAYDMELFLRIAPELYLKRLVVGGIERVYEINRNFRNEGVSTRHNPEFTMLEFYMAHGDYKDGMAMTEELMSHVAHNVLGKDVVPFGDKEISFKAPFARYTIEESLIAIGGFSSSDIDEKNIDATFKKNNFDLPVGSADHGTKLFALFECAVEHKIVQPTFIIGYPIEVSPLSKRDPHNPKLAARFELFIAGMELSNGFTELNDPFDQAERFKGQAASRSAGNDEAHYYDADFIRALEYGLPPTVGVGIGIDRLVMLMTNTTSIKDVILFPTLKSV